MNATRTKKGADEGTPQAPQMPPMGGSFAGGVDTQFGFIMGQILELHKEVVKNTESLHSIEGTLKSSGDTLKELNDVKNKIIGAAWVIGILLAFLIGVVSWGANKAMSLLTDNISISVKQPTSTTNSKTP
jgi:hypothetical protein